MPSNYSKYTRKERTSEKSYQPGREISNKFREETGINVNSVRRWVRGYRRKHKLPSYAESLKLKHPVADRELIQGDKEGVEITERKVRQKRKRRIFCRCMRMAVCAYHA